MIPGAEMYRFIAVRPTVAPGRQDRRGRWTTSAPAECREVNFTVFIGLCLFYQPVRRLCFVAAQGAKWLLECSPCSSARVCQRAVETIVVGGIGVIELEAFPSEWVSSRFLSRSSQNTLRG